jgi:succinate dehydrogenase / fumarate reductase iron-sulfur subunit
MSDNGSHQTVKVRIQRFNPDLDKQPRYQTFTISVTSGMTVLDALHEIKTHQDGSLTYRRSCRHAICGSCAMNVNGKNTIVCNVPLTKNLDGKGIITIRPLPYLPIIKDLVVDRTVFWQQYLRIKPWLIPLEEAPEKEFRMSQEEVDALNNAEQCIMCGACYSACPVVGSSKKYIGPHALLKCFLRVLDPRDAGVAERLAVVGTDEGVFRCHTVFNCIDACPKGLDPTKAIETLRGLASKRKAYEKAKKKRQKTLADPIVVKE